MTKLLQLVFIILGAIFTIVTSQESDLSETRLPRQPLRWMQDYFKYNAGNVQDYGLIYQLQLNGSTELGYYYVSLYVGTPPQQQTLIVDTGSGITSFPCSECKDCGRHINNYFDSINSASSGSITCKDSSLYKCSCQGNDKCGFSISYAEGSSLAGFLMLDNALLGDEIFEQHNYTHPPGRVRFAFGCTTRETHLFRTQAADGILGLGVNTNLTAMPNIIDYSFSENKSEKLSFSLCFGDNDGVMGIGGLNYNKHLESAPIYTVPLTKDISQLHQYTINVHKIELEGEDVGLTLNDFSRGQGTFVDSGATFVFAHQKVHDVLVGSIQAWCKGSSSRCGGDYARTIQSNYKCFANTFGETRMNDFYDSFPKFNCSLDNNSYYVWTAQAYLTRENDLWCLGIDPLGDRTILGQTWMKHHDVLFDRQNSRLSFAQSNCSSSYSLFPVSQNKVDPNADYTEPEPKTEPNVTDDPSKQPSGGNSGNDTNITKDNANETKSNGTDKNTTDPGTDPNITDGNKSDILGGPDVNITDKKEPIASYDQKGDSSFMNIWAIVVVVAVVFAVVVLVVYLCKKKNNMVMLPERGAEDVRLHGVPRPLVGDDQPSPHLPHQDFKISFHDKNVDDMGHKDVFQMGGDEDKSVDNHYQITPGN